MKFLLALLLISKVSFAQTTTIKDATQDFQMKVNSDGSINVNAGGSTIGTVNQGNAGTQPWPVTSTPQTVSSTTITSVNTSTGSSVTLVNSNSNRLGLIIFDESASNCFVAFASTSSPSSYTMKMFPFQTYTMESPIYQGAVSAYCNNGTILITEY